MKLFKLWPTKSQYLSWGMPSKLTFIAAYISIATLLFSAFNSIFLVIQNSSKPSFSGTWDDSNAKHLLMESIMDSEYKIKFGEYGDGDRGKNIEFEHKLLNFYHVLYKGEPNVVGVTYSKPKVEYFDCHACRPSISFFEFIKNGNKWTLEREHIDALKGGEWGYPPEEFKVLPIGYGIFGVLIEGSVTSHGSTERWVSLYSLVGSKYREIFNATLDVDVGGGIHGPIQGIKFIEKGDSYYDMQVKGIYFYYEDGVNKTIKEYKPDDEEALFKFSGIRYKLADFIM